MFYDNELSKICRSVNITRTVNLHSHVNERETALKRIKIMSQDTNNWQLAIG